MPLQNDMPQTVGRYCQNSRTATRPMYTADMTDLARARASIALPRCGQPSECRHRGDTDAETPLHDRKSIDSVHRELPMLSMLSLNAARSLFFCLARLLRPASRCSFRWYFWGCTSMTPFQDLLDYA